MELIPMLLPPGGDGAPAFAARLHSRCGPFRD